MVETATFTIGAESGNVIKVTATLKRDGQAIDYRAGVMGYLSTDADGDNLAASAPTGGFAVAAKGVAIEVVADKSALFITDANGQFDINITDTGTPTFYLVLVLPDGSLVVSGAITFA